MLRLLLQLLFFSAANDADLVCARQLVEELCAPPASGRISAMAAAAADSARSKPQPMLPPELSAECWEWAPLPAAPSATDASLASSDESDAASGPSTRLTAAMSWPTLLSALFDESLAALSSDHSSRATVLGSLSLLELLLAIIDSALFVGAKQSPDISHAHAVRFPFLLLAFLLFLLLRRASHTLPVRAVHLRDGDFAAGALVPALARPPHGRAAECSGRSALRLVVGGGWRGQWLQLQRARSAAALVLPAG